MTGLPNRQAVIEGLDRALAGRSDAATVAFVHIDPKGFKEINQALGQGGSARSLLDLGTRMRTS